MNTNSKGTPSIEIPRGTRIVDEFEPKVQASGSRFHHYTSPLINSGMAQQQSDQIRKTYKIPDNLECRFPCPNHTVVDVKDGEVATYLYLFKFGVKLPLQPFFCQFLTFYGYA